MTESRAGSTGQPGQPAGSETAAPAPASVPPQYSRMPEPDTGATGRAGAGPIADEDSYRGMGAGSALIAATAGRAWGAVLAGGLGLIAVAIMLLVWPTISLTIVAILIGVALVVSGLVRLFEGFTARSESGGTRTAYIVIGLLAVIAGIYCIRDHALSLFLVAFVAGVYFILHGISDLGVAASASGMPGRGVRAVLGVVSLAAGIIMIVWPSITLVLLYTIVAAWLLFYGLMLGVLAFALRRAGRRAEDQLAAMDEAGRPVTAGAR